MPTNWISAVEFRPATPPRGVHGDAGQVLLMLLRVTEPSRLVGFLEDVVTRFKVEWMAGPPDARYLWITVIGDVSASEFADAWRAATAHDAPARALLGTMDHAIVVQNNGIGGLLGQASLLAG